MMKRQKVIIQIQTVSDNTDLKRKDVVSSVPSSYHLLIKFASIDTNMIRRKYGPDTVLTRHGYGADVVRTLTNLHYGKIF